MKYESGLVSVIIPTYKRSEKLVRAVESVLTQTYTNIELLLVNDNEPEDEFTLNLKKDVEKFSGDTRFRLIMQEKHINGAVARNVGIKQAMGEYIAFLDDDDWWEKDKIEKQVSALRNLPNEWGAVSCRTKRYKNDEFIGVLPKYRDGYVYKDVLMREAKYLTGTLLLKHEALDEAGYFDENLLRHQDLQLLVDFTSKFKLKQLDEFLFCSDISDAQNRPNGEKLLGYKEAFFKSVMPVMDTLTKSERKCIYSVHSYELGYIFLKNHNLGKAFKYCVKVFASPKAVILAIRKSFNGIKAILFK